jgi:HEAT repeat protein
VLPLLNDRQPEIRNKAICALSKIADDTSVNTLINLLSSPDVDVRKEVISCMGGMTNQTVKSHLQHLVQVEKDESVIQAVKEALSKIPRVV